MKQKGVTLQRPLCSNSPRLKAMSSTTETLGVWPLSWMEWQLDCRHRVADTICAKFVIMNATAVEVHTMHKPFVAILLLSTGNK